MKKNRSERQLGAKKLRVHFRRPRGAAVEFRDKGYLIQGPTHTQSSTQRAHARDSPRARALCDRVTSRVYLSTYIRERPMLCSTGCMLSKNTCFPTIFIRHVYNFPEFQTGMRCIEKKTQRIKRNYYKEKVFSI